MGRFRIPGGAARDLGGVSDPAGPGLHEKRKAPQASNLGRRLPYEIIGDISGYSQYSKRAGDHK